MISNKAKFIGCIMLMTMVIFACNKPEAPEPTPAEPVQEEAPPAPVAIAEVISPEDFQAKLNSEGGKLLDVRTPEEYSEGHLANAENINFFDDGFKAQIAALPKDQTYFVYCRSGGRSGKTMAMMKEAGFQKVYDMEGGFTAWSEKGLPAETP